MAVNGVMPASRHGSGVKDLTYLARICEPLARGPGLSVRRADEAFAGTDKSQLT